MTNQEKLKETGKNGQPISDRYQAWLATLRKLARLICQERQLGRKDDELLALCRPFLEDVNRVYAELKADSPSRQES